MACPLSLSSPYKPAPATINRDDEGNEWLAKDHAGKVILVEYWAPRCASCVASFPHLKEIQAKYAGRDDFVMVSVTSGS